MSNYRTKPGYRDQYNPLRGLSLSRIVAMEDAAARGEMADLQWLWRHMQDTDVTVASAVAKRLGYIESLDWEIRTIENTDQILAAEQAAVLRYAYERVQNLQEAAKNIAYANFTGFSILEKIRTGYGPFVSRLEYIPCQYWNYRKDAKQWYFNPEARSGMSGSEIADPRELVIQEVPAPLFKPICRHFFAKQLALADWDVALENGANQAVFMIGPPGTTPDKESEYMTMAEKLTSNMRGYLPPGSDIKVTDLAARSRLPYFDRIEYSDRQIVMAATGGLLTMLTESGSGTLAGNAHSETLVGLARADAAAISEVFQRQFDREILKAFFPGEQICVYFKFDVPRAQETTDQIIEAISALSWSGYRINQQQLEEKLGLKIELMEKGA